MADTAKSTSKASGSDAPATDETIKPSGGDSNTPNPPQEEAKSKTAEKQRAVVESVVTTDPTQNQSVIPSAGTGPDAQLVRVDDEVEQALFSTATTDEYVTLSADVVEEFFFPDTVRPSHRILYSKGQVVRRADIEAYNAAVKRRKLLADNDGIDPENPAGIDATTIASGTKVGTASK